MPTTDRMQKIIELQKVENRVFLKAMSTSAIIIYTFGATLKSLPRAFIPFLVIVSLTIMLACVSMAGVGKFASQKMESTFPSTALPAPDLTETPTLQPTKTHTVTPSKTPTPSLSPTPITPTPVILSKYGPGPVTIPILLYHHVRDDSGNSSRYSVSVDNFRMQMSYLHENGFATISISDLQRAITQGQNLPPKAVAITFDDGDIDIFSNAYPILEETGYIATMYVIASAINSETYLTSKMINELVESGWEIGSHSVRHSDLTKSESCAYEICTSRRILENDFGLTIQSFAYPYGLTSQYITQMVRDCGYTSAVGLGLWNTHDADHLFYLSRREVQGTYSLEQFTSLLRVDP